MRGGSLLVAGLLLAGILAGCLSSDDRIPAPSSDPTALVSTPMSGYLHDLSPLDETVKVVDQILEHVWVTTTDGTPLDTWIVRPDTDEPVPIVMEVTPYYPGGNPFYVTVDRETGAVQTKHNFGRVADVLVASGYAFAISSVRGTGQSGGCFTQGGPSEAVDTAAVIEHMAAQPWSNGNVGLIGVSYPGTTPQDVWVEAPPSLKTIVPISGISDMYRYNFVNGVPIDIQGYGFNTYYWAMVGATPFALGGQTTPDPTGLPEAVAGEACADQVAVQEGGVSSTLDGNKDAYWQVRDFGLELVASWEKNPERASVFFIHGLQDWNVKPHMMEEWLPLLWESEVPMKVWIGQWGHNWPQREDWWNTTLVAWFDQFLKDIDTGILDAPAVQVQDDMGRWRHETTWPPIDTDTYVYHPSADGSLDTTPADKGTVRYHDGYGLERTGTNAFGREVATWVSEPLSEDMTISGMPRFVANVSADAREAALILTLTERFENGTERPFNFAALSLNHANSLENGQADITGQTIPVDLRFFPQDDVVLAGSRLVLKAAGNIVGGPGPSLLAPSTGATITIEMEGALLELPVDRTLVYEDPQPCWKGQEKVDAGESHYACYLYEKR